MSTESPLIFYEAKVTWWAFDFLYQRLESPGGLFGWSHLVEFCVFILKSPGDPLFFTPDGIIWLFFEYFILRLESSGRPLELRSKLESFDLSFTLLLGCSHLLVMGTFF